MAETMAAVATAKVQTLTDQLTNIETRATPLKAPQPAPVVPVVAAPVVSPAPSEAKISEAKKEQPKPEAKPTAEEQAAKIGEDVGAAVQVAEKALQAAMDDAVVKAGRSLSNFQTTQQVNIPALEKAKTAVQVGIDAAQAAIVTAQKENIETGDAATKLRNIKTGLGASYDAKLTKLKAQEQKDLAETIEANIAALPKQPDLVKEINPILVKIIGLTAPDTSVKNLKAKVEAEPVVKSYIAAARQVTGPFVKAIEDAAAAAAAPAAAK
jgi:hypothetical protein